MSSKKTTPPLRGTPPKEWNNSPSPKGWQAKPDGVVPKLRFPEFRGAEEWIQKTVGDVSDVFMCKRIFAEETNPNDGVPFYKIGTLGGDADAFISREQFEDYKSRYNFPRKGEVLITCSGTVGKCLPYDGKDAYFQDSNIVWLDNPTGAVSNEFLLMLLSNVNWGRLNSTTITRIYSPDLRGLQIRFPEDENEQHRIAECLSSVDEVIAAQARKVDALKTHKKGLMQQLFPREGETQPRLRFPEFQKDGAWEEKRLSSEVHLISGMHLSPDQYSTTGEVPYFTGPSDFTNEIESVTKWTKRSANMSAPNDTLITVKGSGVGEVWYSTLQAVALGRQLMAVRVKKGSSQFIFQFLLTKKTRFEDLGSGNLIPGLSRTDILDMEAHFPSPEEQQRIAECLSSLDALIAAETHKLEALKRHKRGLMQQLFPSPGDAEI